MSPSINPSAECDECGATLRDSDSGHGVCLYCRLPDLLDQQLFLVRESVLRLTDDPAIRHALDAHRAPDHEWLPVLRPGDTCVSPDRLTFAQVAVDASGAIRVGIAERESTSDSWPRKEWLAKEVSR
jgi:hypothetical protein